MVAVGFPKSVQASSGPPLLIITLAHKLCQFSLLPAMHPDQHRGVIHFTHLPQLKMGLVYMLLSLSEMLIPLTGHSDNRIVNN